MRSMRNKETETRLFPIQAESFSEKWGTFPQTHIPWWLAEVAYEFYAKQYGTRQTLERLAERGGFGRQELIDLLDHEKFKL